MEEDSLHSEAKRRIELHKHEKAKRLFFLHVFIFLGAVAFWFLTIFSGAMSFRIMIPAIIWIVLILKHGMSVFRLKGALKEDRQREVLELEMDKIQEENEEFEQLELREKTKMRKKWDEEDLV